MKPIQTRLARYWLLSLKTQLKNIALLSLISFSFLTQSQASELITPRIVGGGPADDGPYQWTVSLQSTSGSHRCGASLIAPQWIVTAEHCIDHINDYSDPVELKIVIGRNNLESSDGYEREASEIIIHPDFGTGIDHEHDIALIKLNTSVDDIAPLPLADSGVMNLVGNPGDMSSVLGWGRLEEGGSRTDQLMIVDVPIVSNSQCNIYYNGEISDNMLCAGYEDGGKDSCQGDSGGPLVVNNDGLLHLAGIVSWGSGCARPEKPGVYTRVEDFASWIYGITGSGASSTIENGNAITNLSGSEDGELFFTLDVPANASNLNITIDGGSGDADLYVRFGFAPTTSDYDCRPYDNGNSETCTFDTPLNGTYHIMLRGYRSFSGVTLLATFDIENIKQEPKAGDTIQIQNVDKNGFLASSGNDVIHQSSNSGDKTLWTLISAGGGAFYLLNNDNNRYLDYDSDGDVDTSSNQGSDKEWELISISGNYLIQNVSSNRNLDADSSGRIDTSSNTDKDKQWIITVVN